MKRFLVFIFLYAWGGLLLWGQDSGEGRLISINDTKLYVEIAGKGSPVVLIHGLSLDTRFWDWQWETLQRHFQVIRYDVRGFGHSARARDAHLPVEDLKALLDSLKLSEVSLIGHSMGGNIALRFTAQYPQRVAKLVCLDANFDGFEDYTPALHDLFGSIFKTTSQIGWQGDAFNIWLRSPLLHLYSATDLDRINLNLIVGDYHGDHFINPRIMPQYGTPTTAQLLPTIKVPTLVIWGQQDEESIRRAAAVLTSKIPQAQSKIIAGAGHLPNIDRPKVFNRIVINFLK